MLQPHFEILPPPQRMLWPSLAQVPSQFVLYGGTALALRLGHRSSVDFDFFASESFAPDVLLQTLPFLRGATILQNVSQTLTVRLPAPFEVKVSFFGGLSLGRVGAPDWTAHREVAVASLLDLAGTKAAVVTQRAESKDYLDLLALVEAGIGLPFALAAARAIYGPQYNPTLTLKSLAYFGDGDLHRLTDDQKNQLRRLATRQSLDLPHVPRISHHLHAT